MKTASRVALAAAGTVTAFAGIHLFLPFYHLLYARHTTLRVRDSDGVIHYLSDGDPAGAKLVRDDSTEGWHLHLPHYTEERRRLFVPRVAGEAEVAELRGERAIHVAERILPAINSFGGRRDQVADAVSFIEATGAAGAVFQRAAEPPRTYRPDRWVADPSRSLIRNMDMEVRLALEMTAHEETERRALEGELALLEDAWREAEEVAAIADRLLIPRVVETRIEMWKARLEAQKDA